MLVEHRDPDVREAAAALWLCDPSNPEIGRRLARDSETDVRHHLARGLKKLGADAQELRDELEGCLADDSSADVRQAIKDVVAAGKPQR
ncbi:HEAT repeat domain-containing protein [Dactylosporangium darangshiense]